MRARCCVCWGPVLHFVCFGLFYLILKSLVGTETDGPIDP